MSSSSQGNPHLSTSSLSLGNVSTSATHTPNATNTHLSYSHTPNTSNTHLPVASTSTLPPCGPLPPLVTAGKPRTISVFQTHQTPMWPASTKQAEIVTDRATPPASILGVRAFFLCSTMSE
ncbi:hypothetical protein DFH08DRAFT_962212 [Mycena albidolilacea]|uniref:26S proteasome non-ATPase regulatory subunit RPN1 C-terminal domain-containing protein n=1 Tax=Mycena albidolilacea TaxID=1033008 RepID=A0AAD6ZYF8_9AGAR|nr:hypothetical protein DFH08DRAFT_962212 [Mycena albidolilacea]